MLALSKGMLVMSKLSIDYDVYAYGSVSAGREKWPFNILFS